MLESMETKIEQICISISRFHVIGLFLHVLMRLSNVHIRWCQKQVFILFTLERYIVMIMKFIRCHWGGGH